MHQEYQIFQLHPSGSIAVEFEPFVDEILVVFLSDDASMLFICRTKPFNDDCNKQIQHHHLNRDDKHAEVNVAAEIAAFFWAVQFEMVVVLVD